MSEPEPSNRRSAKEIFFQATRATFSMKASTFSGLMLSLALGVVAKAQDNWTDRSPHKTEFITLNGVKLHYLDWGGKGETMLFLHGIGDTPHISDVLAPKFTNQFRVLGLTRRGHGESEIPDDGYDTATRVEDIRQFLDALTIRHAILVGHSAAGNELSLFAITHPERATKLVYLDAAFYIDGHLELLKRYPPELFPSKADGESLDSWRRWYQQMNSGWSEAVEASARVNFTVAGPEKRARALGLMIENEARPDHTKIKSPALMITVINPGADVVKQLTALSEQRRKEIDNFLSECREMKEKEIELFRKAIPNGRVVMLTNADHNCFIDREDEVLREMRKFLSDTGSRRPKMTLPPFVDLQIPLAPTPVKANGKQCLVYELHITNFFTNKLELTRLEVFGDRSKEPLATYRDEELVSQIAHVGFVDRAVAGLVGLTVPPDQPDERTIGPGLRAVMFLLLTVDKETDIPRVLRHRLFFKPTVMSASDTEDVVEGAQIHVVRKRPLVLGPPVRGEGWLAAGALSNTNYHRRSVFPVDGRGRARIPERFAIDWAKLGPDGNAYRDDYANTNAYAYGEEVLAVANAVVADVKDGIPENDPASKENAIPLSLETAAGNYVFLDLGNARFAHYAHLQPNSVRVRPGQRVRRGQVLGLLGNSGHSHGPHLHFHVVDANSPFGAEGVPYVFESFEVQGVLPSLGDAWKPTPNAKIDKRRMEIPTDNAVVRFP